MSKLDIAVAGAGHIGLAHMGVLRNSPTCRLSGIVDPAAAAAQIAADAGVPWYPSLDALFEETLPNGVIVATPNQLHVEHGMKCIEAGVPALLEKPIAPTVAEATQLIEIAEEANARILIGHHRAHSPIMEKARQIVEQRVLGRLVAVMGRAPGQRTRRPRQPAGDGGHCRGGEDGQDGGNHDLTENRRG